MKNSPLVSVIMPFYRSEKFIEEAIESVLSQTYSNWELLLIDDGSTDGSSAIAMSYSDKYKSRVQYFEHSDRENHGASASRNLGIRNSTGKYISFLDTDDVWFNSTMEQQVQILEDNQEVSLVCGSTLYWYSWTGRLEDRKRDYVQKLGVNPGTLLAPPSALILLPKGRFVPCICSILVRRDVIESIGGFEEDFKYINTDQAFYAKLYLKEKVLVVGNKWAKYRQHQDSSCAVAQKSGQTFFARLSLLNWLSEYLLEQGVVDPEVWKSLKRELWIWSHYSDQNEFRNTGRSQYFFRRLKKWILRLEELILPAPFSRWLWTRHESKVLKG